MVTIDKLDQVNLDTEEGKLLLAALSILTSMNKSDIHSEGYGGSSYIGDVMIKVNELANKVFYEKEWESYQIIKKREDKLNDIGIS